ncbi:MAG: hypothetical protein ABIN95_14055 [Mucilaginibacter sp.]
MKKILLFALLACLLYACGNKTKQTGEQDTVKNKDEAKQLFDRVIAVHDEVMTYERMIMENKMKLDSLSKLDIKPAEKDSAMLLSKNLTIAENAMGDWMHKFEPDYSGKPNDEAIKYLTAQETQIKHVDSLTKAAIKASWQFYSKYNK